jgi:cytoskeletal protein CcmA (bactofilin family)
MFDRNKNKPPPAEAPQAKPPAAAPARAPQSSAGFSRSNAVIGPSIVIKGTVTGDEDILVEGKVEGTIDLAAHEVSVGESGEVKADVTARVVRIEGKLSGDVQGKEKVVITQSGNVRGNIVAPRVILEDGATFKGSIDMTAGDKPAASPVRAAPAATGKSGEAQKLDIKNG